MSSPLAATEVATRMGCFPRSKKYGEGDHRRDRQTSPEILESHLPLLLRSVPVHGGGGHLLLVTETSGNHVGQLLGLHEDESPLMVTVHLSQHLHQLVHLPPAGHPGAVEESLPHIW